MHAHRARADYFDFEAAGCVAHAFDLECALFHALAQDIDNAAHPAAPQGARSHCFICQAVTDFDRHG